MATLNLQTLYNFSNIGRNLFCYFGILDNLYQQNLTEVLVLCSCIHECSQWTFLKILEASGDPVSLYESIIKESSFLFLKYSFSIPFIMKKRRLAVLI